ncbi:MAG: lipopolysaccharide biosynthesis protein [Muribaculaceae bacterium]|nr:lipopolysaccharide biosynthesis protein [Muribaculaceae bacterium]
MKLSYYIWNFIEKFGTNLISFAGTIILSYLLSPAEFGLVGMVAVFTSVIWVLIDCGLADSILMYKDPSDRDINTVFVFNLSVGIIICLIYVAIAPFIANFFGYPEIRVIMVCMGISAIFSGLTFAQVTKARSKLQFRTITFINLASISLALFIAISMAYMGLGYLALVELQVGFSILYFIGVFFFTDWKIRMEFDIERFRKFWNFGINLFISYVVIQFSKNIYSFVLGKYYSATHAGFMGQAQKLQETPTNSLEISISNTSYILIAKKNSAKEKNDAFMKAFNGMTFTNSLFIFFILALSAPIIMSIFPERWHPVIPYIQAISLIGLISPIENFTAIIFKVHDRTATIRNIQIVEKSLILLFVFLMIKWGLKAMIMSNFVIACCALFVYIFKAHQLTGIGVWDFYSVYLKNLLIGAAVAVPTYFLSNVLIANCYIAFLTGVVLYVALALLLCRFLKKDAYYFLTGKVRALLKKEK